VFLKSGICPSQKRVVKIADGDTITVRRSKCKKREDSASDFIKEAAKARNTSHKLSAIAD